MRFCCVSVSFFFPYIVTLLMKEVQPDLLSGEFFLCFSCAVLPVLAPPGGHDNDSTTARFRSLLFNYFVVVDFSPLG